MTVKAFSFRLEAALRLRTQELEVEQMKLQQLLAQQARLQHELEAVGRERKAAAEAVQAANAPSYSDLRALASYIIGAQAQSIRLQSAMTDTAKAIAKQTAVVIRAEQGLKLLDKLRQKRASEWAYEVNRELENDSFECWISSWNRKGP